MASRLLTTLLALAVSVLPMPPGGASAQGTGFDTGGRAIDIGVQPAAFPLAMFSEAIKHDRILKAQLAEAGWRVQEHPYLKGKDMFAHLTDGRLEAVLVGDVPAIRAAAQYDFLIAALLKHGFSSVVTRRYMSLDKLKGRRIGNEEGSTAHHTLLEGLASVGLGEKDVVLVDTGVHAMPAELTASRIDAFSAWEPAPTIALATDPDHFVAYRGVNNSYLLFNRQLAERHPEVVRLLMAAFARAIYWMRRSPENLHRAAGWAVAANRAFLKRDPVLSVDQAMKITREETLRVPGLPGLARNEATTAGRMARQFGFLQARGKLPHDIGWDRIARAFAPGLLEDVLRQPGRYRVHAYDYGP